MECKRIWFWSGDGKKIANPTPEVRKIVNNRTLCLGNFN